MASVISAGTTSTTALNLSGDTTGNLAFQTQNGTYTITVPNATGTLPLTGSAQTYTAPQRGTVTTDNDLSFDMSVTNNFKCTPSAGGALTFTNITAGQSGFILLINGSNYSITAAGTTKVAVGALTTISQTGTYLLGYFSDGTNVYVTNSNALA